ncbi:MAG TPA: flagellin FliC [Clostridia bacterium]|nr:flagellin FliC [Clostridia bacterium]
MGLRINSNIEALNAHRNLGYTTDLLSKSMEKLSSGLRINRAADDAAGLAISEKLKAQVRGLNQAIRNAQDGISLIQTAEGALTETHSILQRMRELAIQAANGTLQTEDKQYIQSEIDQLIDEVDRIANQTEFNKMTLLNGSASLTFQIGANQNQTITFTISSAKAVDLTISNIDVVQSAQEAICYLDDAIKAVSESRADLGAIQNRLEHTIANLGVASENLQAAGSRIRDVDMAQEMMNFTKLQILQQAGTAMLAQANLSPQAVLQLLG